MKTILFAVVGLSPQVITETLFGIYQSGREVTEIVIITTTQGRKKIFADLVAGKHGILNKFLEEYEIPKDSILFDHDSIHVIKDEYGNEISDLESEEDNNSLLKLCLEIAFELTCRDETAVYFSIAGGRKTMSSCLTLAAQLYGRQQDRLCHVLISPEFENCDNFYYPPKKHTTIKLKDKSGEIIYKNTKYAKVNLVNIPFVSIRKHYADQNPGRIKDPGTLMLSLVQDEKPVLRVDFILKKIIYKGVELDLMPAHLALYGLFAVQKKNCTRNRQSCGQCTQCFLQSFQVLERQAEITEIYKKAGGFKTINESRGEGILNLDYENLRSLKSKIKKNLETRFGRRILEDIEIASIGTRPDTCYGIMIDKSQLEIVI